MTSICSSQERIAARSSNDVATSPDGTLFTIGALALGATALVLASLGQAAVVDGDHSLSLATPAIFAFVSAPTVAFSRTQPDRATVLSTAIALVAIAVMATFLGANAELAAICRLLGGLGFGAVVGILCAGIMPARGKQPRPAQYAR